MIGDASNLSSRAIQLGFLALLVGAWQLLSSLGTISPLLLPSPDSVRIAFVKLVESGQFWSSLRVTGSTVLQAWAIAMIAGSAAAYAITRSRFLVAVFEPVIAGIFAIPLTLLFPLYILFLGIGPSSKVAYAATYGFFPVALNAIAGFSAVKEHYLRAAHSMGASAFATFRHVMLPASFPIILTGIRISFFITFASVLGGETLSSVTGIGKRIALAAELMEPAEMFAWIVFVIVFSVATNMVLSMLESRASAQ
ncbi:ABC transporter permease [Bosea sp. BK604]|uniref:ABC transporter permease n=1 Tax=Bosea sp. BK604 TaxID=2512180 RepID=UPI00104D8EDB|nr:ABC transporter permease [Bosea sp. BK604]TCR70441.1 NitT/TauT family transport system permease protein [Bosea sp. BK604]